MNRLSIDGQAQVIRGLVEGNSIASLVRMTGIAKTTILRLMVQFADACKQLHDERVCGLRTKRLQMDEVWSFVGAKDKNTNPQKKKEHRWGDAWTWTAIDADTKLMIAWLVGPRRSFSADEIAADVAWRIDGRVQVTTDGLHSYKAALAKAFGGDRRSDYATCVKVYRDEPGSGRYSPGECTDLEIKVKWGDPDPEHISTSYVERSNLTVRMGVRRYTRLTNAHSKKFANHVAMTTVFMTCYNFCRVHQTLKMTPAMAAGLTDHPWDVREILALM